MEPPIYNGKIHPNEYVKKMRVYCNFRQITNEQEILKFAIMMIDSTINIPENINSFDTLINTLKNHISFTVFKNSCKRKLQALKYISEYEGDNTVNFVTDFRTLCRDAEIANIEEQKKYIINALPYNFFKNEFVKHEDANSTDELIRTFEEIVSDYSRIIKNGSIIALRHVSTGKYLSSCDREYPHSNQQYQDHDQYHNQQYQDYYDQHRGHNYRQPNLGRRSARGLRGGRTPIFHNQRLPQHEMFTLKQPTQIQASSLDYMIYCGDFGPNALWSINNDDDDDDDDIDIDEELDFPSHPSRDLDFNPINYKSSIQIQHKILSKSFYTNISKQSPTSKHFEVCCGNNCQFPWSFKHYHNHDNKGNVKSQDIILLQWNNNDSNNLDNDDNDIFVYPHHNNVQHERTKNMFLRSHDLYFTVDNESYQEVVTHDHRIGGNDQWCIELVEHPQKNLTNSRGNSYLA
ncbi:uncharacterized protein OCT59_013773 [Rhizophagus irregularis]|uniref:MIR domain-containing protein n=3 Tax=Rhizophagus irregularis TaxID=588596 RepID=A0A015L8H3_RHIIW|nr:hypothetical protein GLOIN_2v1774010 [Rhizophagus irregularis DAOM 181602=DAOM 197198]EXX75999.1 hypothetical protein RirG_037090 [Rhizophagus irregularis DAOM 197198w]POG72166.1 hypothetical protein GLOIN_2v1774010 [Rhizophagus irregularis DAOM 181602=DAOM 197198]UZO21377.1 hypothetical protein OCT59_013773 [Rhizophagus irregularis]GBC23420.1 hypothetical protein GLOIN_2v1774010 [Rhizophagus irregularis DAOM 181602=DAOM 197198]|eukprot:XP_025179032.1 hypothetical protein GLOIN_2v1774010 [Rhizophagus irregularis DAOM 181602=DAOM 197198]